MSLKFSLMIDSEYLQLNNWSLFPPDVLRINYTDGYNFIKNKGIYEYLNEDQQRRFNEGYQDIGQVNLMYFIRENYSGSPSEEDQECPFTAYFREVLDFVSKLDRLDIENYWIRIS